MGEGRRPSARRRGRASYPLGAPGRGSPDGRGPSSVRAQARPVVIPRGRPRSGEPVTTMTTETDDEVLMAAAIDAAVATPAARPPWPSVGCVIARDGVIVGRGATGAFPVGPHAEVAALAAAGDRARGATAYTTLEPCDHDGNTPPCTRALIEAGVARVVMAVVDPDAKVAGRGLDRLRDAGVAVSIGTGADGVEDYLGPYLHQRRTGRAFALLKTAMSLDGRTAAADGTSQWITSPEARADAHRLRAQSHAVLVGPATATKDAPSLTVRDAPLGP